MDSNALPVHPPVGRVSACFSVDFCGVLIGRPACCCQPGFHHRYTLVFKTSFTGLAWKPLTSFTLSLCAAMGLVLGDGHAAFAATALVAPRDVRFLTHYPAYGAAVVNISVSGMRQITTTAGAVNSARAGSSGSDADQMQLFLRRFQDQFGATMQVPVHTLASGFIVSSDGLILTNAHVVVEASEVVVKLTDRREFRAKVLSNDPKTDMAVLKIAATHLPIVAIGKPADLQVRQWVLAINGQPVSTLRQVRGLIFGAATKKSLALLIQRDTEKVFLPLRLPEH